MISRIMTAASGAALAIALAASQRGSPAAVPRVTMTTTAQPPAAASASASSSAPAQRLTRKQAARAYVRIVDPWNVTTDAINRDYTDDAPFSQYRADSRALVRALRTGRPPVPRGPLAPPRAALHHLAAADRAYRWTSDAPGRALRPAAGQRRSRSTTPTRTRQAATDSTTADTIRSMLNLPPRS